jgi:hypothetical protein
MKMMKNTESTGRLARSKSRSREKMESYRKTALAMMAGALLWPALSAPAATMVLTNTAPTPGPDDQYQFIGSPDKGGSIGDNDQYDYVATGRPTQGQTFTTSTNFPPGYYITDIWAQHCGYTEFDNTSGNGTWWNQTAGSVDTIRVTDSSKVNEAGFALSTETYTWKGTENDGADWTGGGGASVGDGMWLHFTLSTPIHLAAGTQYGFDLTGTVNGNGCYWEWLGTNNSDIYPGGRAYTGSDESVDNSETFEAGARVFLVQLSRLVPAVAPVFSSESLFAPVGQPVQVTVTIPPIVNANNTVTLNLVSTNTSLVAFSLGGLATETLTFAQGAANSQTFTAYILGDGASDINVTPNVSFNAASIQLGSSLSVYEPFAYNTNTQTSLDQADGGIGFSAPWDLSDGSGTATVVSPGLTYGVNPSLVTGSTNAATVSGTIFRSLPEVYGGVGGGTVWVSFLVRGGGLGAWGGISLFQGINGTENLFMGEVVASSANNTWGFSQSSTMYMDFSGSVTPGNQTDFLVYRIDFPSTNGGEVLVTFYADPPLNTRAPLSPTGIGYVNAFTFDTIRLGTAGTVTWDEIRMGTEWTNVVPFLGTPAPPSLPTPTLSAPANFVPIGQAAAITVSIPAGTTLPLAMTITNSDPVDFSLSPTNAGSTTLMFGVGSSDVQTLNVQVMSPGSTTLTVVSNASVNSSSVTFATQVLESESFKYAPAADGGLAGDDGGIGFDNTSVDNPWAGGGGVTSPGLTYPGLLTFSNCATITAAGTGNANRLLALSSASSFGGTAGGTVWISFLIQGAVFATPQYAGLQLLNSGGQTLFMGLDTTVPNNGKWGFTGPGAGETGFPNSVAPSTNVDLLVYRIDFPGVGSSSDATVTFYADPVVGPAPPATPTGVGALNNPPINFDEIQMETSTNINIDEIRLGGTWAQVVPMIPSLSTVRVSSSQVQISWPVAAGNNYALESSPGVAGPWANAGLSVTTLNGQSSALANIGSVPTFYRLVIQ